MLLRILTVLLFFLCLPNSYASSVLVPTDYSTIKDALNNINPCDTIVLEDGTYSTSGFYDITFVTPPYPCFAIISLNGADNTTIDLQNGHFLNIIDTSLYAKNHEQPLSDIYDEVLIKGIQIINGNTAIKNYGFNDFNIRDCIFSDNHRAIEVTYPGMGEITNCRIQNNYDGAYITGTEFFYVKSNIFLNNTYGTTHLWALNISIRDNIYFNNDIGIFIRDCFVDVSNNIIVNNDYGIDGDLQSDYYCNDVFNNIVENYRNFPDQTGIDGNISEEPYFCDTSFATFGVGSLSPLLPDNNDCGVNIGNVSIECYCGDVNVSGDIGISDITYFVGYMFNFEPAPNPIQAGEINGDGEITISDLTYIVDYLFNSGNPPVCGLY